MGKNVLKQSKCALNKEKQSTKKWYEYRPICSRNPAFAPKINGKTFLLCYRCTGGVIGAALASILLFFVTIKAPQLTLIVAFMLITPAIIDHFSARFGIIKASNKRRFITGVLLGVGVALFFTLFSHAV